MYEIAGNPDTGTILPPDVEFKVRYLTLAADYRQLSLRDERTRMVDLDELPIPRELVDDLVAWNDRYQAVVPTGIDERQAAPAAALIEELDRAGLALAARLAEVLQDQAKVRYYSEGLFRHIP